MVDQKIRKDSSSSSLGMAPVSPIPSSVEAIAGNKKGKQNENRKRSGSIQERGAAMLRALARAPEEQSDEDSGYEDEGREARLDEMPRPARSQLSRSKGVNGSATDSSLQGLTEAEKQTGRQNREGLRRRKEDRQVERIVTGKPDGKGAPVKKDKKKAKSWEIPRKIFHSSIGFLVLFLYLSRTDLRKIIRGLSIFLGIVITADVIRLNNTSFEWLYEKVLGFLMRESEKEKVNGVVWYLIGVNFCLQFFPEDIACVSIMILSWADTAASVFGRLFGALTPPLPSPPFAHRKSLAGTIAASVVSSLTAALFWITPIAEMGRRSFVALDEGIPVAVLCIGSGLVGGIAEGLELGGVDDNLSLPILSAFGIKGVVLAWKWLFG